MADRSLSGAAICAAQRARRREAAEATPGREPAETPQTTRRQCTPGGPSMAGEKKKRSLGLRNDLRCLRRVQKCALLRDDEEEYLGSDLSIARWAECKQDMDWTDAGASYRHGSEPVRPTPPATTRGPG